VLSVERRLAVLGSPIGHSRSPDLHNAAYAVLGLPWRYDRIEVPSGSLEGFLHSLDESWRGLSLTMPLKREVLPMLDHRTELVDISGAANTVLLSSEGSHGYNTDVAGILGALADHGLTDAGTVHVIGTGNTAGSAVVAASRLGATQLLVSGRSDSGLAELRSLGERLGVPTATRVYGSPFPGYADLVINTLPGGVDPVDVPEADLGGALMEVPYDPWPTPRAARWGDRDVVVVSGLEMLLHQAIEQVRIFVTGREGGNLPALDDVVVAMREAVGLNLGGS